MPRCRRAMRGSHRLLRRRVLRRRGLYGLSGALLLIAGCTAGRTSGTDAATCGTGERALGEDCLCDDECGASAPRCARNEQLEPEGISYCTTSCTGDDCAAG